MEFPVFRGASFVNRSPELPARLTAGAGLAAVVSLCLAATLSPVAGALRRGDPVSGIALGTDLAEHSPHSDTLLAWVYRPRQTRLDVVSIPRDTRLDLPGYRFRRVNEVYAFHHTARRDPLTAAAQVRNAVQHLFRSAGGGPLFRHVVQVDFDGFRRVVDRWGGVTLMIDEPMDYDDNAGNFHVHFSTGLNHLNGADALRYVRFRGRSGDRGRILRQMEFLRSCARRLASPHILWRGPGAVGEALHAVTTDLSAADLLFLLFEARRWSSRSVHPWLLPGKPRGAYWEMDRERTAYVIAQLEGRSGDIPAVVEGTAESATAPSTVITVKVWNATGRAGLALRVARRLRELGFDVVEWGNYNGRQAKSRVIDRSGHFERARAVAEGLGVASVYSDADPALRMDVDVVLGTEDAARWVEAD